MSSPFDIVDDKFELKGEWWLPKNPEQKLFGVLNYSQGTGTLELQGLFNEVSKNFFTPFAPEIILGNVPGLRGVTLTNCYMIHASNTICKFITHLIFTNYSGSNLSEINFKKTFVNFLYLQQWVRVSDIDIKFSGEGDLLNLKVKQTEPIVASISNNLDISIISTHNTSNLAETYSDFTIKQKKFFRIESKDALSFKELKKTILTLQNFVGFALDEPSHHIQIIGYPDGDNSGINYRENAVGIFFDSITSTLTPERESIRDGKILFYYKTISENFEEVLKNWFRIVEDYEPTMRSISAMRNNPHMYLEEKFSYSAQALESYHSQNPKYENKQMDQQEYGRRIQVILESINDTVIQSWLKTKLSGSHANNKSFLERITEIIKDCPTFMNEPSDEKITDFAKQFRNMRNNLIHPGTKGVDYVDELLELVHRTKILVESLILSELNFKSNLIQNIVKNRKRWYRIET